MSQRKAYNNRQSAGSDKAPTTDRLDKKDKHRVSSLLTAFTGALKVSDITWTERKRRTTAVAVSIVLTGASTGLLIAAAYQTSSYVQGLFLNLGTSLVIIVPLSLLTGLLITRLSDLQRRISLREASDIARMNLKERSLRRAGPRTEELVRYRRLDVLQEYDADEAADQTAQMAWRSLASIAQDITAVAAESGLVEHPYDSEHSPRRSFAAEWSNLSWKQILNECLIGYPRIDPFNSFGQANWVLAAPYDGPPSRDKYGMPVVAYGYPVWRMSLVTFSRGSTVTVVVGHQIVDEAGTAGKAWFRLVEGDVQDDDLDARIGGAAGAWYDRSATELDLLGALMLRT